MHWESTLLGELRAGYWGIQWICGARPTGSLAEPDPAIGLAEPDPAFGLADPDHGNSILLSYHVTFLQMVTVSLPNN